MLYSPSSSEAAVCCCSCCVRGLTSVRWMSHLCFPHTGSAGLEAESLSSGIKADWPLCVLNTGDLKHASVSIWERTRFHYFPSVPQQRSGVHVNTEYLNAEQQGAVGVLQPPLSLLHLSGSLLLFLQFADVIHRRLQDGSFVPPHLPVQPITGHASLTHSTNEYNEMQRDDNRGCIWNHSVIKYINIQTVHLYQYIKQIVVTIQKWSFIINYAPL